MPIRDLLSLLLVWGQAIYDILMGLFHLIVKHKYITFASFFPALFFFLNLPPQCQ